MNAYKKTREKHGGERPCCVVCGEAMDPEDDETEWSRTKRRTDCFVHRHCVKHWGDVQDADATQVTGGKTWIRKS